MLNQVVTKLTKYSVAASLLLVSDPVLPPIYIFSEH